MTTNFITTNYKFDFSPVVPVTYNLISPDYVNISPNGRFIIIGNSEHIYHIDISNPKNNWKHIVKLQTKNCIATDNGGLWVINNSLVIYLDNNGLQTYSLFGYKINTAWGNDDWLLFYDEKSDSYIFHEIVSEQNHQFNFKHRVIHAWKNKNILRLVLGNKNLSWLYIDEIDLDTNKCSRLDKLSFFNRHTAFDSINVNSSTIDYPHHCFSLPINNNKLSLSLQPWNLIIDKNGRIKDSSNYISWHPVYLTSSQEKSRCNHDQALLATIYALDGELQNTAYFIDSIPSLINTYIDNKYIHIITSCWYKTISIDSIDKIDIDAIDDFLEITNICVFFLTHYSSALPMSVHLLCGLIKIIDNDNDWKIHKPLFINNRESIQELFSNAFNLLPYFKHNNDDNHKLNTLKILPEFFRVCNKVDFIFDATITGLKKALSDTNPPPLLKQYIDFMKFILPTPLVNKISTFGVFSKKDIFEYLGSDINIELKEDLLTKMSSLRVSPHQCQQLIEQFSKESLTIIALLLKKIQISSSRILKNTAIIEQLNNILFSKNGINEEFINELIKHDILEDIITIAVNHSDIKTLKFITNPSSKYQLTRFLLQQGINPGTLSSELINSVIEYKAHRSLGYSLHQYISEINLINNDKDMEYLINQYQLLKTWHQNYFNLHPDKMESINNMGSLFNTTIEAIADFKSSDKQAIALCLLSTWLRINPQISNENGIDTSNPTSALTPEAQLLNSHVVKNMSTITRLIEIIKMLMLGESELDTVAGLLLEQVEQQFTSDNKAPLGVVVAFPGQ